MDAEAAHEVKVGGTLLLVSRKKRRDAADDEAALFQEWSHDPEVCRYDSNQRTGGKRVHRARVCVCVCVPVSSLSKVCLCLRWSHSESLSELSLGLPT